MNKLWREAQGKPLANKINLTWLGSNPNVDDSVQGLFMATRHCKKQLGEGEARLSQIYILYIYI